MKKYYFYTIVGKSISVSGSLSHWTYVSDIHPIQQILNIRKSDEKQVSIEFGNGRKVYYSDYWILSNGELTEEEYNLYKNNFEN